jgi:hypothetical protein
MWCECLATILSGQVGSKCFKANKTSQGIAFVTEVMYIIRIFVEICQKTQKHA